MKTNGFMFTELKENRCWAGLKLHRLVEFYKAWDAF